MIKSYTVNLGVKPVRKRSENRLKDSKSLKSVKSSANTEKISWPAPILYIVIYFSVLSTDSRKNRKRSYALVKNSIVQKIRKTDFTDNWWMAVATNYRVFLQLSAWNLWKTKRFKYYHVYSLRTIWMAQQTWRKCPGRIGNRQNSAQLRWYCIRWSEHESLYKSNKNEIKQRGGGDAA